MAMILTDGEHYICLNEKGKHRRTTDPDRALDFSTVYKAIRYLRHAPVKTAGFYVYDTVGDRIYEDFKRKSFSPHQRETIYNKTNGHCYLCGDFVDFDSFEVEHRIPLAGGGSNQMENLFCSCHVCNSTKHDIYPEDFSERITKIFMHQMEQRYHGRWVWKVVKGVLEKMI